MSAAALCIACNEKPMELSMIVGTYTDTESEGVYSYTFDCATAEATATGGMAVVCNPSYLEVSPDGKFIYAVTEVSDNRAALSSYHFDKGKGTLTLINREPTIGSDPCFVSTNGKLVLTANYGGTLSAFPVTQGGILSQPSIFYGSLGGPDTIRQAKPHIHCAIFTPDGKYVFASDFSADRLIRYDVSEDGTNLTESGISFPTPSDCGPRHLVFSKDGQHLYMLGELSGAVTLYDCNDGELVMRQTIKADRAGSRGAGDIHISPDGRFLYASCRLINDGIAIFSINDDGTLTDAGYVNTGIHPRNFNITPDGKYLLCACRDSNRIEIYSIDPTTGMLTNTGRRIDIAKPVCIKFIFG